MAVIDWRAWTDQSGGTLPTAPAPPGGNVIQTPNTMFPGVGPIPDLVSGSSSIPTYPNTPTYVPAVDPFGGWTDQKELAPSYTMRPVVPGVTS
jgi:hypothetical protein